MKKIICYIDIMASTGGAQRVMKNLVSYLIEKDYCVILVNDFDVGNKNSFDIPDKVKRIFLRKDNSGNPIKKNIERIIRLRELVKREKPDIILSFLGAPNIRAVLSTIGLNIKKIISVRNDPRYEYGKGVINKFAINLLFTQVDGCVFQTDDAKKYFNYKLQSKSRVILNPVDKVFFNTKRADSCAGIVTIGRLEDQKNHKLLIQAYSNLLKKEKGIDDLYIYGDGSLRGELRDLIDKNGLQNKVHLLGKVSNVADILSKSKLFILSSDFEGLPNVLMEAMACGTPVISTDCPCGGPKMLIKNIKKGILVRCNDVKGLEDSINSVIYDNEVLEEMSIKVRKRAEDFESSKIFSEWEEYLNLIG